MADPHQFWSPDNDVASPGLSAEQIRDCSTRLGVRLPDSFAELYSVRNGGSVRDENLTLFPLPTSDDVGEFGVIATVEYIAEEDEFAREMVVEELGNPQFILLFAGDDGHTYHALDFNVHGPDGEPRVLWLDFECSEWDEISPSFGELVEDLTRSDDECAIDMHEIERLTVIAHETIDHEYENGIREQVEQHLCDAANTLVLFVSSNGPEGQEFSRVEITKPLDVDACVISPMRPKPNQTFMLMLQPEEDEGILWTSSRKTSEGRWKNGTSRGVPVYAEIESTEKARLKELRTRILGGEMSARAAAEEEWQERMEDMSEEDMEAAFPHLMLQMMGEMEELVGDLDPDDTPAELKPALQHMEQLKAKMKSDLEQRATGTAPPNAELLDLMQQMMPKPEDFNPDD